MRTKLLWALSLCLLISPFATAEIVFNGFASIVTGIDLNDEQPITSSTSNQAYTDRQFDQLQESRLGLQMTADLEDGLRFIGQLVAKGEADVGYVPKFDWAYFDINVGANDKLKIGRVRIPFYKYSDYIDIGYAYHWIAPPKSMYALSFTNADGISYLHNNTYLGIDTSLSILYGRYQGSLVLGGNPVPGNLENLITINLALELGNHQLYTAYAQADLYIDTSVLSGPVADAFTVISAANPKYGLNDGDTGRFAAIGYQGAFNYLTIYAEYSTIQIDDGPQTDTFGGYLGASYLLNEYLWHITFETETDEAQTVGDPTADFILQRLGNRGSAGDATTINIGVRKDIGSSSALKVEVSQYDQSRYSGASTTKLDSGYTQLRIALETMF